MMRFVALALIVAVGVINAQEPQRCFSPPELTFEVLVHNHQRNMFGRFEGQYDARNERTVYVGESVRGRKDRFSRTILIHKEKAVYEVNDEEKKCKKFHFEEFYPFHVPKDAKFEASYRVGGPRAGVVVDEWYMNFKVGGVSWLGQFTQVDCYPVNMFIFQNHKNESESHRFVNVVEGIVNPDWFVPPSYCH